MAMQKAVDGGNDAELRGQKMIWIPDPKVQGTEPLQATTFEPLQPLLTPSRIAPT